MKIYPYLSYRREINETDVNYTCNLQKVWDSSDSLNGNSCSLFIFIRSTIPMISVDFLTRWNAITVRKGREIKKDNFQVFHIFGLKFQVSHLTKEPPSFPTFQVKARQYVNFIAIRKYNFPDYFLFRLVYKIFAVTIRNITPKTERTFQSRMLTSLRNSSSVSSFCIAYFRFTQCTEFLLFFT